MSAASRQPLEGVKVIELGQLIAGPFCARMLAEFGAEVIKIEPPRLGDPLRKWRKLHDGTSLWWYAQARNKKSVTLDLKQAEAQEIVRKLAAGADIVVENFRPGALEKLGARLGSALRGQPGTDHGPAVRFRPDRAVPRPARLRRHRRVHGRAALRDRLSRTARRCASGCRSGTPSRRCTA